MVDATIPQRMGGKEAVMLSPYKLKVSCRAVGEMILDHCFIENEEFQMILFVARALVGTEQVAPKLKFVE